MYFYLLFVAIYQVLTARYDRILFLQVYLSYEYIFLMGISGHRDRSFQIIVTGDFIKSYN